MDNNKLSNFRKDYARSKLDPETVGTDPLAFLGKWLDEALGSDAAEPTAMTLSTVSADGQPSSRTVLLKGMEEGGLLFFTNYQSRKGLEVERNNRVALHFAWHELERQVRIEGIAEKVAAETSDAYFLSRPAVSQVSAIISPQSTVVPDREYLEKLRDDFLRNHVGDFRRPDHWGGYRVIPNRIEFWQGRPGRLHDRVLFVLETGEWKKMRLAP